MNSKYLIILLLVIILVLLVLKNKNEFFKSKTTGHNNIKCNQKGDKKYVIFYPKNTKNAKNLYSFCNVTHYDKSLEMFQFESSKKPSISVKIDNKLYKVTITCKIRGGPVFTGKNWALTIRY